VYIVVIFSNYFTVLTASCLLKCLEKRCIGMASWHKQQVTLIVDEKIKSLIEDGGHSFRCL